MSCVAWPRAKYVNVCVRLCAGDIFSGEMSEKRTISPSVHFDSIERVIVLRSVRLHHRAYAVNKMTCAIRQIFFLQIPNFSFRRFKSFRKTITTRRRSLTVKCFFGRKHEMYTGHARDSARCQICVRNVAANAQQL